MSPVTAALAAEAIVAIYLFLIAAIIVQGGAIADFLAQVAQ